MQQAEQAGLNREAAAERASESNQTRQLIAGMAASGRQGNQDLQRQILQDRIDAAKLKEDDAQRVKDNALKGMQAYGDDMLGVIGELLDEQGNLRPHAQGVVGTLEGAIPEYLMFDADRQKALASTKRLNSNLAIETLQKLKEQSRTGATGFGSLTEKELALVENAKATLSNRRQDEATYAAELKRIRDAILSTRGGAPAAPAEAPATAKPTAADLIRKYRGK
jgi:hypothetical protein